MGRLFLAQGASVLNFQSDGNSNKRLRDQMEKGRPGSTCLLFWFVGEGFELALCNVGWLATRESVVLAPKPIVFAPWSVVLDRGEPCDSCQRHIRRRCFLRIGKRDVYQQPEVVFSVLPTGQWTPPLVVVLCSLFCPMPCRQSVGRVSLAVRRTA